MMEQEEVTNTYVFDSESPTELARLINQDRIVTQAMGGALSGVPGTQSLYNVLDLGCGPGGWVLDVAFALPFAEIEGVDSSRTMVNYANARARTQKLPNTSFGVMDMTKALDLPDASFDLVNARFLAAVLKREVWVSFLSECNRVLRPGGFLRLTEPADFGATTSEEVNQLSVLTLNALYQLGYGFSPEQGLRLLPTLLSFFKEERYQQVAVHAHALDYSVGTIGWPDMYHNVEISQWQMKPKLVELELINEAMFDLLYQQVLIAMQSPGFCGIWHLTTVIGQKPLEDEWKIRM
jgi:ubiquinone/menaquinone biosynthesis C-methylase UbiE